MKVRVAFLNKPTVDKRVIRELAFEKDKKYPLFLSNSRIDLEEIIGSGTIVIEGDVVYSEVELLTKDEATIRYFEEARVAIAGSLYERDIEDVAGLTYMNLTMSHMYLTLHDAWGDS